jgi:myo-inositol-1(or 4)-monophosphatase
VPAFRREVRFAAETAQKAGDILRRGLARKRKVSLKGSVDLITEIDVRSEKFITDRITRTFPEHSILAEEGSDKETSSAWQWVVDPLDGTTNYAHGYPAFCVSIGLEVEGEMVVGAVHDPLRNETFFAARGRGAYLNRRKISVTGEKRLSSALLATGFPYDVRESKVNNLGHFARMYKACQGIRRGGSAALDLCYLACGRFDGFWELKLHPWDTAAGIVIVKEAGGRVSDFRNRKYSIYGKEILASNGKIHNQMREVLLRS